MAIQKKVIILSCLTILAFWLRVWRLGNASFKEDEFTTVKAAAYIYECQNDSIQCRHQPTSFNSRLLALVTANETKPNLGAEIYLWDFIKAKASSVHFSRAWPHLYAVAAVYRILGISELSSRLVSVVAGSLLAVAGYWLSRVFGSSVNLSLLYSGLLAISFPLIDFSRNARMYSLYVLVFLFLVGLVYKSKWWLALPVLLVAYWLQMLTLVFPLALLVWSLWRKRFKLAGALLLGLILVAGLNQYFRVDFFGRQFLGWIWPAHWEYLHWGWILALSALIAKRQHYLVSIILVYLLVLIFFTRPAPASAYMIALWPLGLWPLINWRRPLTFFVTGLLVINFVSKITYLYFGRDGRAQIPAAYTAIKNNFQLGDKIYAVQLRDYYLRDLPPEAEIIDLQANPDQEFSGSGFVVWEEEKTVHLKPETLEYIRANFEYLGSNGVEIYSFGK